jgi:hypothetical protein
MCAVYLVPNRICGLIQDYVSFDRETCVLVTSYQTERACLI